MLGERIIELADAELGVQEEPKGSNRGKRVEEYLKAVGLGPGNPWCAAFVNFIVQHACALEVVKNRLPCTGHVKTMWARTPQDMKVTLPQPGDVFVYVFDGGTGHTGFVLAVNGNSFTTIEGNSNDEHSREGYEVCSNTRTLHNANLKGFIRVG